MNPVYVYTALIDVLAYRSRLEQDQNDGTLSFMEDLEEALNIFNSVNEAVFGVQAISDTIILTCSDHSNFIQFLNILKDVFASFLSRGLFVRGGVAYSRHFSNKRLTYSHSVALSYKIENRVAIYPRIVIDKNIVEMYRSSNSLPNIFGKNIFIEQNGIVFLNILTNDNWAKIYKNAKSIYFRDMDNITINEGAFLKHKWFENYLFAFAPDGIKETRYIEKMKKI